MNKSDNIFIYDFINNSVIKVTHYYKNENIINSYKVVGVHSPRYVYDPSPQGSPRRVARIWH